MIHIWAFHLPINQILNKDENNSTKYRPGIMGVGNKP